MSLLGLGGEGPGKPDGQEPQPPVIGLSQLRELEPPPSLVPSVMRAVAEPPSPTFWRWLRRPFRIEIRLSPLGAAAFGLGLTLALAVFVAPRTRPTAVSTLEVKEVSPRGTSGSGHASGAHAPAPVLVRFVLEARGARRVAVAGSFNDWNTNRVILENVNDAGLFVATVPVPSGIHEYMFVVDGEWVTDPSAEERRPDGFGRENALLRL
jgi:hypothetical protein